MAAVAAAPSRGASAVPRLLLRQVALRRAAPEQQETAGRVVACADRALHDVAGAQQASAQHAAAQHAATDSTEDARTRLAAAIVSAMHEKHAFELDAAACFAAFGCPALRALSAADEQRLRDEAASALHSYLGAEHAERAAAARVEDAVRRVGYAAQRAQEQLAASEDDLYLGLGAWEAADSAATCNSASEQQQEEEHEIAGHTLPCFLRALLRELQALMQHEGGCSDDDEACVSEYRAARGLLHTGGHLHAV